MDKNKECAVRETASVEMESYSHNEQFARVVAAVFASRLDPTIEELEDIKTAVSEAVTNAVIHGYEGKIGKIRMDMELYQSQLTISVHDWGCGIADIRQAMEPLYTSKPARDRSGMGFTFMETFMDSVDVISAPENGTSVIMKKKIGAILPEQN